MRYWKLKFVYNKASVKSTALQNCTGQKHLGKQNHTKNNWIIVFAVNL